MTQATRSNREAPLPTKVDPPPDGAADVAFGVGGLQIKNLDAAYRFAQFITHSAFYSKGMDANTCVVAIQFGAELGLPPVHAVNSIAVINNRPTLWGDTMLGLCRKSRMWDENAFLEWFDNDPDPDKKEPRKSRTTLDRKAPTLTAHTRIRRKGSENYITYAFSMIDAKAAGLDTRETYQKYLLRMLKYRARAFTLRDGFGDILTGLYATEEMATVDQLLNQIDMREDTSDVDLARCRANIRTLASDPDVLPSADKVFKNSPVGDLGGIGTCNDVATLNEIANELGRIKAAAHAARKEAPAGIGAGALPASQAAASSPPPEPMAEQVPPPPPSELSPADKLRDEIWEFSDDPEMKERFDRILNEEQIDLNEIGMAGMGTLVRLVNRLRAAKKVVEEAAKTEEK